MKILDRFELSACFNVLVLVVVGACHVSDRSVLVYCSTAERQKVLFTT